MDTCGENYISEIDVHSFDFHFIFFSSHFISLSRSLSLYCISIRNIRNAKVHRIRVLHILHNTIYRLIPNVSRNLLPFLSLSLSFLLSDRSIKFLNQFMATQWQSANAFSVLLNSKLIINAIVESSSSSICDAEFGWVWTSQPFDMTAIPLTSHRLLNPIYGKCRRS